MHNLRTQPVPKRSKLSHTWHISQKYDITGNGILWLRNPFVMSTWHGYAFLFRHRNRLETELRPAGFGGMVSGTQCVVAGDGDILGLECTIQLCENHGHAPVTIPGSI